MNNDKMAYLIFDIMVNGYVFHEYVVGKALELCKRDLTKDEMYDLEKTKLGGISKDVVKTLVTNPAQRNESAYGNQDYD